MVDDPIRELIEREMVIERGGWVGERLRSVTRRLRPASDGFEVLVFWSDHHTAFTGVGDTIYISRRLFERLDEESTAFVVAHELAHHRLGHVPSRTQLAHSVVRVVGMAALEVLDRMISTRQNELEADALAVDLCLDAGYDPDRFLTAFDHLAAILLDYRDLDRALGRDDGHSPRSEHPPLDARVAAARARVAAYRRGQRISPDVTRERRRARRRRIALAVGGVLVTVAAIVLWRRPPR